MDIAPLNKWIPNLKRPLVIAGPCSAETQEQVLSTAHELKLIPDVRIFRAGIWKPRTRPNTFEGVGEAGLPWIEQVKKETGLLTCVEVASPKHIELALKYNVDILWIGARTSANPFAVQEIADCLKGTHVPVMVKNPINADLALWIGAIERLVQAGLNKIVAIHRGFSSFEKSKYRNLPLWEIPIELKRRHPGLPIICDPSHITGKRELIAQVSQRAMDVDMDGLMIETHPNPEEAWSDASQQVTPSKLKEILSQLSYRTEFSIDRNFEAELDKLRAQIDRIDSELLEALRLRKNIVDQIAKEKIKNNVTPFQLHRLEQLMKVREQKAIDLGLPPEFARDIFSLIHAQSVKQQADIMNNHYMDLQ